MADPVPWTFGAVGDVSERLEWLTDVMPATYGTEQRRALRIGPRVVQQFDTLEKDAARRQMEHLLASHGSGLWRVPLTQDQARVEVSATLGATTIEADARLRRFVVGERALIIASDPRVFDLVTIATVADTELTLEDPTTRAWAQGSRIIPLVDARLEAVPLLPRWTGETTPVQLQFAVRQPMDWPADPGAATYRTAPVLELVPDWSRDPEFQPERRVEVVDNDTGVPAFFDQPGVPLSQFRLQFSPVERDEVAAFRSLLYALKGRWSPLWVPSQAADLKVAAPLVAASADLDVEWCGVSDWPLVVNRRDVRIELRDGTVLYRRITAAAPIGDGSTERLVLDSALGVTAAADDVFLVSFLALCRQEADVNHLRYWSRELVQCELSLRAFVHDL